MFKAAAKLRLNHRLDDLARHSPVRERDPEDLPGFNLPRSYAAEPILFSIVSPLDPSFVHMPLHKDGESLAVPTLSLCSTSALEEERWYQQHTAWRSEHTSCQAPSCGAPMSTV